MFNNLWIQSSLLSPLVHGFVQQRCLFNEKTNKCGLNVTNFFVTLVCESFKVALRASQLGLSLESCGGGDGRVVTFQPVLPATVCRWGLDEQGAGEFNTTKRK